MTISLIATMKKEYKVIRKEIKKSILLIKVFYKQGGTLGSMPSMRGTSIRICIFKNKNIQYHTSLDNLYKVVYYIVFCSTAQV